MKRFRRWLLEQRLGALQREEAYHARNLAFHSERLHRCKCAAQDVKLQLLKRGSNVFPITQEKKA